MKPSSRMNSPFVGLALGGVLLAQSQAAEPTTLQEDIVLLASRIEWADTNAPPPPQLTPARYATTPEGYVRFFSAAPGHHVPPTVPLGGQPEQTAHDFLQRHSRAFGVSNPAVAFQTLKIRPRLGRTVVRLQQTYAGIPVFAAQVNVQVNARDGIESVLSDVERDTRALDQGVVSTIPTLSAAQVVAQVRQLADARYPGVPVTVSEPALRIFAPSVLGVAAGVRLAWELTTGSATVATLHERFLIDAHNGGVLRRHPLLRRTVQRRICDANNSSSECGTVVREEGDPICGLDDADETYLFLADTYDFYMTHHERDSIDAEGMMIKLTVRYCDPGDCPWYNAGWDPNWGRILVGEGYVADDVVAHEFTHGVSSYESELIGEGTSGAIAESFCDSWGEFVDLTNGHGNDDPTNRWWHGEDLPGGPNRNMKNPPWNDAPDRRGSKFYRFEEPTDSNDEGWVHSNCGVGNKLCYLLTDGDTFNGHTVTGQGIDRTAALYYAVNTSLLPSGADWTDLYEALVQAAENLNWSLPNRNSLYHACAAVEIAQPRDIYVDKDSPQTDQDGTALYPFHTLARGLDCARPGDNLHLHAGSYAESMVIEKTTVLRSYGGVAVIGR